MKAHIKVISREKGFLGSERSRLELVLKPINEKVAHEADQTPLKWLLML